MKRRNFRLAQTLVLTLCCGSRAGAQDISPQATLAAAASALEAVREACAPDPRLAVFNVGIQIQDKSLVVTGEVDRVEARQKALTALARAGLHPLDHIKVLPDEDLGDRTWGLVTLSVGSGRSQPEHKAEMVTQFLLGSHVRVLKRFRIWYYVQGADGYLAWVEKGSLVRCNQAEAETWENSRLLMVTNLEDTILAQPKAGAEPVSDVVICDLVQRVGEVRGHWFRVRLPDGREGYLPRNSAEDFEAWKHARHATPDDLERTARRFLGRPYLWGGVSPKGLDCSGFTRLVFFLNGIELNRDASQQVRQGREAPLDDNFARLRKGDLLFFGRDPAWGGPQRIYHVGMYLGDKLFIQSSELVRISSLDPASPLRDDLRIRTLLCARRILEN